MRLIQMGEYRHSDIASNNILFKKVTVDILVKQNEFRKQRS